MSSRLTSWLPSFGSAGVGIANSAHEYVYCFVEADDDHKQKTPELPFSIQPEEKGGSSVITGTLSERTNYLSIQKGAVMPIKQSNIRITIVTDQREVLCYRYQVPNHRTVIVGPSAIELARGGEQWTGESGQDYQKYVQPENKAW